MTSTKPQLQANAAYENGHLVAQDLLQRINELLHDLPAPDQENAPINWANVGDIVEVNKRLVSVIEFLS